MNTLTTINKPKRITLATVKSFIRANSGKLFINVKSSFDGMTDGCEMLHDGFQKAIATDEHREHKQGIAGAWFVGQSRDYFSPFEDDNYTGITVSNSCGHFVIAVLK